MMTAIQGCSIFSLSDNIGCRRKRVLFLQIETTSVDCQIQAEQQKRLAVVEGKSAGSFRPSRGVLIRELANDLVFRD